MNKNIQIFGMGGSALRSVGMETVVDSEKYASVMGVTEVVGSLGKIVTAFKKLEALAKDKRPDVLVLVDYPDFNLRLAKACFPYCKKIIYFISPQLWAWRKGRIKTVKKYISKVIPIFPFEEKFYAEYGVEAKFVGHPFMDHKVETIDRVNFLSSLGLNPEYQTVALLPGSREAELERLAPLMKDALIELQKKNASLQVVVAVAKTLEQKRVENIFSGVKNIAFAKGATQVLSCCDAGIIASGTATIEAAVAEIPFVVVYKLSSVSHFIGKLLVRGVKYFAMPNLIAGREVVKEFLQEQANVENVSGEIKKLLSDPNYAIAVREDLKEIKNILTREDNSREGVGTSSRVASVILEEASKC
jgi:lipid-A-disaccharide synthase